MSPQRGAQQQFNALSASLDSLDDAENYRDWILSLIDPYVVAPTLELGAGQGTFTGAFGRCGDVLAVEPDEEFARALERRFDGDPAIRILAGTLDDVDDHCSFSTSVMINVLEHIEDDRGALEGLTRRLLPGGHIALWVPAFPLLYSEFDRGLGHYRRYRRRGLEKLVTDSGLEIVECKHVNLLGWFSWLLLVRLARQQPTAGPLVGFFDRFIVPPVRWLESRVPVPFGQSLLMIARRPASTEERDHVRLHQEDGQNRQIARRYGGHRRSVS